MQITKVSAYSLAGVLKNNAKGIRVVGYTVRPGFSNGLNMTNMRVHSPSFYVGFFGLERK